MDVKILVLYIGVAGIRSEDIEEYTHKVTKKIIPQTFEGEIIIIPIQSMDCRIECINPKFITDVNLVIEHTEMMKKLQAELQYQLDELKKKKNE
jgi:hypothetical protein